MKLLNYLTHTPAIYFNGDVHWTLKINDVPSNLYDLPRSDQIKYAYLVDDFNMNASCVYLATFGEWNNCFRIISAWVLRNKPSQYFCKWNSHYHTYEDDYLKLFYKLS